MPNEVETTSISNAEPYLSTSPNLGNNSFMPDATRVTPPIMNEYGVSSVSAGSSGISQRSPSLPKSNSTTPDAAQINFEMNDCGVSSVSEMSSSNSK